MRFGGVIDIFQVYILLDTEFLKRLLIYLFQFPRIFLEDRNDSEKTAWQLLLLCTSDVLQPGQSVPCDPLII
jgi:hypothetical protein